jgi:AhpD family alkylhydroperoxidase
VSRIAAPTRPGPMTRVALAYARRRFGKVPEPFALKSASRKVFWSDVKYEMGVERGWTAVAPRLRELAVLRSAQTIGCHWCVDFGSRLSLDRGLEPEVLSALPDWQGSPLFDATDRAVLSYAEAMSTTPPTVTDAHVRALQEHLGDRQVVELTALIALENSRARFNDALGVVSQDFCAVPAARATERAS